mmetsp:Transcript_44997/g.89115  ORF Transcript_44997/g.89115 Transcript_44997/m.89115 type:complete len:242 (-) Transcript_44997:12-737(-)
MLTRSRHRLRSACRSDHRVQNDRDLPYTGSLPGHWEANLPAHSQSSHIQVQFGTSRTSQHVSRFLPQISAHLIIKDLKVQSHQASLLQHQPGNAAQTRLASVSCPCLGRGWPAIPLRRKRPLQTSCCRNGKNESCTHHGSNAWLTSERGLVLQCPVGSLASLSLRCCNHSKRLANPAWLGFPNRMRKDDARTLCQVAGKSVFKVRQCWHVRLPPRKPVPGFRHGTYHGHQSCKKVAAQSMQ